MQQIAFFDFDGTITTKDSLLEFIKFSKGNFLFYVGFLLCSPWLIAYKLKIISNQRAKEVVLGFFFRGITIERFHEICEAFAAEQLPSLIRPKALKEIQQLQAKGVEVVIVSASPENWLIRWAKNTGVQLIATRLAEKDGKLTGLIFEHNCHGKEKVRRIQEQYTLTNYGKVYAYGDTSGDKPMLALADVHFYKPFR